MTTYLPRPGGARGAAGIGRLLARERHLEMLNQPLPMTAQRFAKLAAEVAAIKGEGVFLLVVDCGETGSKATRSVRWISSLSAPSSTSEAMVLYAFMGGAERADADALLKRRWDGFETELWPERLRAGDDMAWREKLIGYYLGHVKREEISGHSRATRPLILGSERPLPAAPRAPLRGLLLRRDAREG